MKKTMKSKLVAQNKRRIAIYVSDEILAWIEKKSDELQSTPSGFSRLILWDAMKKDTL